MSIKEEEEWAWCNSILQEMFHQPPMQQLAINPAFFTKAIPPTSYLIHKGLRCFTSKMTSRGIGYPVALPQAAIVIWFFLTEDVHLTFFCPFHAANFSGWESNEIPDSSILRIYLLWVIFQDKFTQNFFVKIIILLNIFTINCLHSDLSSELKEVFFSEISATIHWNFAPLYHSLLFCNTSEVIPLLIKTKVQLTLVAFVPSFNMKLFHYPTVVTVLQCLHCN